MWVHEALKSLDASQILCLVRVFYVTMALSDVNVGKNWDFKNHPQMRDVEQADVL